MFIPKEIAPYLGMIAPMVAPQLGITGSLLLSQAGSWKERGGKWDPYSALATGIALSSPQARQIREMGRMDPTKGTVGQRLSAGFGKSLNKADYGTTRASGLQNWFDPTRTVGGEYSSEFLKDYSKMNPGAYGYRGKDGFWGKDAGYGKSDWQGYKDEYKDWKFGKDAFGTYTPGVKGVDYQPETEKVVNYKNKKYHGGHKEGDSGFTTYHDKTYATIPETKFVEAIPASWGDNNLTSDEKKVYLEKYGEGSVSEVIDAKDYLEGLDKRAPGYDPGFWGQAGDFGSDLAGAIFPGWYDSYDPVTGRGQGGLNFSNVVQTITVAATLSSVMAIKEELEKEKDLDEAEERKIWKEWFDSYERTSGHTYEFSPYREEHLWEMYQKYMAKGGRVGYNLGGGIMEAPGVSQGMQAPGVPQGMQLDGRDGAFVPQGIEEKADDVPAMLSKNEFVLTADAMRGLDKIMGGRGDPRAAAQHMYQMMDQLEAVA